MKYSSLKQCPRNLQLVNVFVHKLNVLLGVEVLKVSDTLEGQRLVNVCDRV